MTREAELAAALESRAAYCDELASLTVGGIREMHRTNAELFRRAAAALATQAPPEPAGERAYTVGTIIYSGIVAYALTDIDPITVREIDGNETLGRGWYIVREDDYEGKRLALRALATPPQSLDGVTEEMVERARQAFNQSVLQSSSDKAWGKMLVHETRDGIRAALEAALYTAKGE